MAASSAHLVDDFEAAFQNCLAAVSTQESFNVTDPEEVKTSVEHSIQKFLDVAKQLESFFLQKRFILSINRPDQVVKEDITELRSELARKETLLQKHTEKLQQWNAMLNRAQGGNTAGAPATTTAGVPSSGAAPQPQQASHANQPNQQIQQQNINTSQAAPVQAMPPPSQNTYPGPLAYLEQTTSNIGMPERR